MSDLRVIDPEPMLRRVADILDPVRDHLAVFGATGVQIVLANTSTAITPTRDVDVGVVEISPDASSSNEVIKVLESALQRSDEPQESAFTWVGDGVKIQVVRDFAPFPKGAARRLPDRPPLASMLKARQAVAFSEDPSKIRLWVADPPSLLAMKQAAFGRMRGDGAIVERDFADAHLLMRDLPGEIAERLRSSEHVVRSGVLRSIEELADESSSGINHAARELVAIGQYQDLNDATIAVVRSATQLRTQIDA